jgi:type II secretory pathway pseudopilin PulG
MKNNIPLIITILSLAVAVGGISYGVKASNERTALRKETQALRDQLKTREAALDTVPESDEGKAAAVKPLSTIETNDLSSLEKQLAARDAEQERLRSEQARRQNSDQRESFQDRMARMKEEDPERYAAMIKHRTERREQMRYAQANRLAILMDVETGNMTPEELANHNLLLEKLNIIWEQTGALDPEQLPDRETMHAIFASVSDIQSMMEQERAAMLRQLGTEVGLNSSDAEDFSSYVQEIFSATTLQRPRGGRRSGGYPRSGNSQ